MKAAPESDWFFSFRYWVAGEQEALESLERALRRLDAVTNEYERRLDVRPALNVPCVRNPEECSRPYFALKSEPGEEAVAGALRAPEARWAGGRERTAASGRALLIEEEASSTTTVQGQYGWILGG